MMEFETLSVAYPYLIKEILENGKSYSPRGMKIKEICGFSFKLFTIDDPLPLQESRKLNYKFGVLEGLLNIAGVYPKEIVLKYNKNLANYINPDSDQWNGAYAPRISPALKSVYNLLKEDPDTRQAILPIFNVSDTFRTLGDKNMMLDIPCTISLQFLIRDGKLNTIATMRSNDVLWGLSYDMNQFTTITRALASWLGIRTGWYIHQAGSFHSYDEREDQLIEIIGRDGMRTEKYADFKHPEWGEQNIDFTMLTLRNMFNMLEGNITKGYEILNDFPEPFHTYLDYLTGTKKINYV